MKYHLVEGDTVYTGEQLASNFAYRQFGIAGDSIVAFCGPCDVKKESMVDLEDLRSGSAIYSERMLHFIVEHHDADLERNILRQIMLAAIVKDVLNEMLGQETMRRTHTDLYDGDAKISVSVATVSPISALIHFGINISSKNTPVKTRGLEDYKLDHLKLATDVMSKYVSEIDHIDHARCKVKWVQ